MNANGITVMIVLISHGNASRVIDIQSTYGLNIIVQYVRHQFVPIVINEDGVVVIVLTLNAVMRVMVHYVYIILKYVKSAADGIVISVLNDIRKQ